MLFLEDLTVLTGSASPLGGAEMASLGALGTVILLLIFLVSIGVYLYMTLAYKAIGKKAKDPAPSDAWIPALGPILVAYRASKMHWWPWTSFWGVAVAYIILIIGAANLNLGLLSLGGVLYLVFMLIFGVFAMVIWHWKMFEVVGKPGWWSLILPAGLIIGLLLAFVVPIWAMVLYILTVVVNFVMIGIAAWSKK